MAFGNPSIPWKELEGRLSGRNPDPARAAGSGQVARAAGSGQVARAAGSGQVARAAGSGKKDAFPGDGSDSPAWSRKRAPYEAPAVVRRASRHRYAELHCHSNFSFLDGASHPEELAEEATRLGLEALAVTDHDGFYGVVRMAQAAGALGLPIVYGAELTLGRTEAPIGDPDPGASGTKGSGESHLVVLARDPRGYALLARAISEAQLRGGKGAPRLSIAELSAIGGTGSPAQDRDHWVILTGCRKGAVPAALVELGPAAAGKELLRLTDAFGRSNIAVELWDHGDPLDSVRNDALALLGVEAGVDAVATNNVHYATPARHRLATALAAVRARRSLDELEGWLPASAGAHLRSGAEQSRRFARYPGVVERAADMGRDCAFDLALVAPALPPFPGPDGLDEMGYLRRLVEEGGERRYGRRSQERVVGAWSQIDHELAVIDKLGFPGYFLIVWDIVEFCRRNDIYCQGRGSAANSAVCFALGVTKADAVSLGLLFERFLSPERDGPPDIDLDIESDRREEVIQYVYAKHGRHYAAQVANVITYRGRSAMRDMAKALGYATGQQDAWAKQVDRWSATPEDGHTIPDDLLTLAAEVADFPRHLGIHSGGMVLCDRPVIEVCPVEWATMADRSVLQWDKDDCAAAGLVKFDLLGLGMLSALHYAVDFIAEGHGLRIDLAEIPQDDAVYDMLCEADSIGVFQVESRAQMATLPRLRPRSFYDLVVEVALIRPGPIQGGSVHPYIRRRNGTEEVTYLHPLLEPSLKKTLGIPLFQEQLMQMAIDVAGFSPGEADQLRQAMGSKRSRERMERLRARFFAGMAERGIGAEVGEQIFDKLSAFANFGFPESHSVSFAYLVYASSWIKRYFPAAFCAALLDAQPMGFYSPHTLVQDARRHGVEVRTPDVSVSQAGTSLEFPSAPGSSSPNCVAQSPDGRSSYAISQVPPQPAVRLGLSSVRGISDDLAEAIVAERDANGPFSSMEDLRRRVSTGPSKGRGDQGPGHQGPGHQGLELDNLEALATAGAFSCFDDQAGRRLDRRRALWGAGAVAQSRTDRLEGIVTGVEAPMLPGMGRPEEAAADLWATGIAPDGHPTRFIRAELDRRGVIPAGSLRDVEPGTRIYVGGVVTHRQRPATAGGTTFINLEDETGLINIICSKGCWARYRTVARSSAALLIRGHVEASEGVVNVIADKIEPLPVEARGDGDPVEVPPARTMGSALRSRDFR